MMRIIAGELRGRLIEAPPGMGTRPMLDRVRQAVFDIIGARMDAPGYIPEVAVLDIFAGSGALGIEALSRGAAYCCFVEEDGTAGRTLQGNLKALGLQKRAQVLRASALTVRVPPPRMGTPAKDAGVAPEGALADKLPVAPGEALTDKPLVAPADALADKLPVAPGEALTGKPPVASADALADKLPVAPGEALTGKPPVASADALADKLPVAPGEALTGKPPVAPADALADKLPVAARTGGAYSIVFLDPPYPLSRDSGLASPIGQLLGRLPVQADLDPGVLVVLRHERQVRYDQQAYGRLKAFDVREYGGMAVTFMELVNG